MEDIRYPKQLLDCRPIERQIPGRPLKRLLDGYNVEAETGPKRIRNCDIQGAKHGQWEVCVTGTTQPAIQTNEVLMTLKSVSRRLASLLQRDSICRHRADRNVKMIHCG